MKIERIILLLSLGLSVIALVVSLTTHQAAKRRRAADFDCVTVINHLDSEQRTIVDSHAITLTYRDQSGVYRWATLTAEDLQALKSNLPNFQVVD